MLYRVRLTRTRLRAIDARMSVHTDLLDEIEVFRSQFRLGEHRFGILAANNGRLVERLRSGGRVWPETMDRVKAYMAERRAAAGNEREHADA